MGIKFTNNAITNLATAITNTATVIQVTAGGGSKFISSFSGDYQLLAITNGTISETVKLIGRTSDTLTVERAYEGIAQNWVAGVKILGVFTSRAFEDIVTETIAVGETAASKILGSSTSSINLSTVTVGATVSITVSESLARTWLPGNYVTLINTPTKFVVGKLLTYSHPTASLLVETYQGTGITAAWSINLTGPQGRPGASYVGEWNSGTSYVLNDLVYYLGNSYISILPSLNSTPPSASWDLVASKGDQGVQGPKGLYNQGTWNSSAGYVIDDLVNYNGSSYTCLQSHTNSAPPSTSWSIIASKGDKGINNLGVWDSGTGYVPDDYVSLNGSSYVCISSHTNSPPPSASWTIVASKGDIGNTGTQGPTGATGPVGGNGASSSVTYGGTAGTTVSYNIANSIYFVTATATASTWVFSSPPASGTVGTFKLEIRSGNASVQTWPAAVKWAGGSAPTLTANIDVLEFYTRDGGTTWRGKVDRANVTV